MRSQVIGQQHLAFGDCSVCHDCLNFIFRDDLLSEVSLYDVPFETEVKQLHSDLDAIKITDACVVFQSLLERRYRLELLHLDMLLMQFSF